MQLHLSILQSTKQDQWGFRFSNGSLNGASPVQVRRSPATVSEDAAQTPLLSVANISHKPENPPLINIPRTFARKGQDYDGISIATLYPVSRMKGFFIS
jgi:hypothetical protein